mgnify:CR=1 FL=1
MHNRPALIAAALLTVSGSGLVARAPAPRWTAAEAQTIAAWKPRPAPRRDTRIEARIRQIVSGMTLEQKIGQMTQPSILSITPDQVRQYYIGSVLNGGGGWPGGNKHAGAADWAALAKAYDAASLSTDMKVKVPVVWGIDAVHGNNNVSIDDIEAFSFRAAPLGSEHQQDIDTFVGSFPQSFVSPQSATWTRGVYTPTAARKRLYKATDPDDSTRLIGMLLEQDTNGRLRQVAWYKAQESSVIFQSTPSSLDFELVRDHNGAPTTDPSYIGGWTWYYCTSV